MNALLTRKIFTVNDYHKMIRAGIFIGDSNYELIEGEIVKKVTQGDYHISCINRLNMLLVPQVLGKAIVSIQNAVVISEISEPEPDVTILRFREDFYVSGKAQVEDILLLIEVSDSTVSYDRTTKIRLYAEAGVQEVWLVNLPKQILEVYTEPHEKKYKVVRKFHKDESVSPKLLPEINIKISEILG